ncbi:MAG: MATE family efflux transporter [Lachnospiraceae bacterium]|nr:MATE family efflux transporter [Lachnospiraceae bacterium]
MFTKDDLKKLLAPLIVEQVLAVLVGMIDVVMVGAVGETAVSGVSLVDSISILIIQVLSALATGGAVVSAQYIGKKQPDKACRAAGQLMFVTVSASAVISVIALLGNRALLGGIFGQVEREVMDNAVIYFFLCACSYPFLAVYNSCAALYRSMGNSRVSMKVSMAMNLMNVAGNAICVFGLHMGVAGVGIPTLLSRGFAAVVMVLLIQRPENVIRITSLSQIKPEKTMIKAILAVGVPNGLENSIFQVGKLTLQSLVSSLGTTALASYAVASNLVTFLYLPGNALGLGLITIAGQCVGAGEYRQAKRYTWQLIGFNYLLLAVISTAMFFGRSGLVALYQLSPEASVMAQELVAAHAAAMIIWPVAFTLPHTLRASFDAKFTMAVSIFSMWTFRIGFAYLFVLVFGIGILGVWYAMFIDWAFRVVVFLWRFRSYETRMRRGAADVAAG